MMQSSEDNFSRGFFLFVIVHAHQFIAIQTAKAAGSSRVLESAD
jgi:hypothetical protein